MIFKWVLFNDFQSMLLQDLNFATKILHFDFYYHGWVFSRTPFQVKAHFDFDTKAMGNGQTN